MTVEELIGRSLEPEGPFVEVRRADVKFSNGHGTVVYGVDDMPPLSFRAEFPRKIGIAKGNAVIVDGELLIERLERLEGVGISATAENSNFKPKMKVYYEGVDDFEVIGRDDALGLAPIEAHIARAMM